MIPAPYENFLIASTQASAALIGLLFVAVSIAPERVFGGQAEAERQAKARSAFIALANVFFVSFTSLIPNLANGLVIVVIGAVSFSQTLALLFLAPNWRREHTLFTGLTLFLISALIYGFEIAMGIQLWLKPTNTGALTTLLEVLLGAYALGLRRAWELLGARFRSGVFGTALEMLRERRAGSASRPQSGPQRDDPSDRPEAR